ncbi:TM2 domain-containing protein [Campylobacter sp. RM16190]|uniref:TM2 domain-containing protein n=1 Tax=Campylobacter sp. RM16190 TaxID=1705727 RepID=UPI001475EE01|nr:TM2 domain-containing protein [Campylobacter sp. RM16190]
MRNMLFMGLSEKISSKDRYMLKVMLDDASDKAIKDLSQSMDSLKLKSSWIGLIFGLLFGFMGVDRFYKGNMGLGVLKLSLFILMWIIYFGIGQGHLDVEYQVFSIILYFIIFLWGIIDLFLVFIGIKRDNLVKIKEFLTFNDVKNSSSFSFESKEQLDVQPIKAKTTKEG